MTTPFATIDRQALTALRIHVPGVGPWWADADFAEAPAVSGRVTIRAGSLELSGTVRADRAGTFGAQRRARIVAGAGAWGTLLPARAYHNDGGIQARTVAEDAAREAGEELGSSFVPRAARLGIDYVRQAGPASLALEDAIARGTPWWVDFEGRTQVGARVELEADREAYEVLEHDPRARVVTLAVDDLSAIGIGSILSERLDEPQTIRELEIDVGEVVRVRAFCGGPAGTPGRLLAAFSALVDRRTDDRIPWPVRYRVVRMAGDRVELQARDRDAGLPDLAPVSLWPGIAGVHPQLTPGADALVSFIEGRRTMPIVTHFAGKDGAGWTPVNLTLDATTLIKLGRDAANFVALANLVKERLDAIQSTFDGHTHPYIDTSDAGSTPSTTSSPTSTIGPLAGVAAEKVQAQ